jgi:hypothetical protein
MHSPTNLIHNDKDNISLLTFYGKLRTHEYNSDEGSKEGVRGATQKFPKFECRSLTT